MKKLLLTLCLLLSLPAWGWAATVYIDTTCANNGDGTAGAPCAVSGGAAGPKNTWVGLTWTAGNTYAGQGGTTATACLAPNADGSDGSPITITSYGTGRVIISCTGSQPIRLVSRAWVTVDNVQPTSSDAHCVFLDKSTDIIISNTVISACHSTVGTGIVLEGQNADSNLDRITITGNTISGLASSCINMTEVPVANSSVFDAITISNNTCTGNATATTGSAISFIIANGSTATMTNLTISGNTIADHNTGQGASVSAALRVIRSGGVAHEDRFLGIRVTGNTITNSSHGISVNNTGLLAGVQNCVCSNILSVIGGDSAIGAFFTNDLLIEANTITGVFPVTSDIDGIGIDVEDSIANRPHNTIVRRNYISNNLGSTLANSGQGIYVINSSFVDVVGNLLSGNKHGLYIDGGGASPNVIANNTVINSLADGIRASASVTQVNQFTNNIVTSNAGYGINDLGLSDQTLTTNNFYNNTAGNYNSIGAGATDILTNPLIVSSTDLRTRPTSPARRAGVPIGICMDFRGRACYPDHPDIGVYQATSGDLAATRTARTP